MICFWYTPVRHLVSSGDCTAEEPLIPVDWDRILYAGIQLVPNVAKRTDVGQTCKTPFNWFFHKIYPFKTGGIQPRILARLSSRIHANILPKRLALKLVKYSVMFRPVDICFAKIKAKNILGKNLSKNLTLTSWNWNNLGKTSKPLKTSWCIGKILAISS